MILLRERLRDWVDWDAAEYHLAVVLGILPDEPWAGRKDIFWTNNRVGNTLAYVLRALVNGGVLEIDDEGRYRWKLDLKSEE